MNVKELLENEELMESIMEDIEDIPEDSEVTYEVWALGYTDDDELTDTEVLAMEFKDPAEAVTYAKQLTVEQLDEIGYKYLDKSVAYFSVEVETVIADPEDEGTMNLGTVYQRDLWIDEPVDDPIVALTSEDYELTKDGELKVSCKLLKDFNKNDFIYVDFVEAPDAAIMTYKIISKVMYQDGDYYHCELMI